METKETSDSKMAEFMMDGLEKGECRSKINPADK